MHALPATLPFRVSEEAAQHFRIQIALALEIAIESAMGETCAGHDLVDRDILEAVPVEQAARAVDDFLSYFGAVTRGIRQDSPPRKCVRCSMPEASRST
jgi:hypothetical protein